jgi:hypothetical protein
MAPKAAVLWLCVQSTSIHQCLGISISKIFVDMFLNTLQYYPAFLLKEHKVSTVPSSLTGNLLLRICSSFDMLLIGIWNTGKSTSEFAMALILEFLPCMGSQNLIQFKISPSVTLHCIFTNHKQNLHINIWTRNVSKHPMTYHNRICRNRAAGHALFRIW